MIVQLGKIMKKHITTLLVSLLCVSSSLAEDIIEIKDWESKPLKDGAISFVSTQKIPDSNFYIGTHVGVKKEGDKITGHIYLVELEGFLELEAGKLSPITTCKQQSFEILTISEEWTVVQFKDAVTSKISIRWKKSEKGKEPN